MDLTGQKLGKYELIRCLGKGGMATVYLAFQPGVERYVALKVLNRHMANHKDFIERFSTEAKGIGKLNHPNIVRVIDYDIDGENYYLVLDYIPGGTLSAYLDQKGRLEPAEGLHIMAQLTDAVAYAHEQGLIHRDIKPDNILFTDETARHVVLTDFGLARLHDGPNITVRGTVIGTPAYVSPEVLNGDAADERSDIYSLGIVLYQMLTGSTPYQADTPYAMMLKQLHDPFPPPSEKTPDVSPQMEVFILKALEKEPNNRFGSMYEFHLAVKKMQKLFLKKHTYSTRKIRSSVISMPPPPPSSPSPLPPTSERSLLLEPIRAKTPEAEQRQMGRLSFLAVIVGVFLVTLATVFIFSLIPSNQVKVDEMSQSEFAMPDQTPIGSFRFVDNDAMQAGDMALQINQILPAPEGSYYELSLMGQNADMVLNLGQLPIKDNQVNFTYSTSEDLLATYHQVVVNLVSNDDSGQELMVLIGTFDDEYISQLRALLVHDQMKGLLPTVVEQSELARQQVIILQNALRANNLPEVKRYTEKLLNIMVGKKARHYGDLNSDGEIENPGDGVGIKPYLLQIQAQTKNVIDNTNVTETQKSNAKQLIALSQSGQIVSDKSISLALELLQVTTIDKDTIILANQLELYILELLEGPELDRETGGVIAAYKYGLRLAEAKLFAVKKIR